MQDNGGGEKRSDLGIVGSGMSVSGNRVRTIPRDQDKYHNSGGNSAGDPEGQPREVEKRKVVARNTTFQVVTMIQSGALLR